jgi:hypothetical protein
MPTKKLVYRKAALHATVIAILEQGWQTENYRDLWLSKSAWYDTTHDDLCHERGVEIILLDELDQLWESWFNSLDLSVDVRAELEALWEEDDAHQVLWEH